MLWGVLIEIGEFQLNCLVYVALLQDVMFLSNDFMQKKSFFEPIYEIPVALIASRSFNNAGTRDKLCLMNLTQEEHIFQQGQPLATATPATETVIPEAFVRNVGKEGSSKVPLHIKG